MSDSIRVIPPFSKPKCDACSRIFQATLINSREVGVGELICSECIDNKKNAEMCKWLRDNSSGAYRAASDAAYLIESLQQQNTALQQQVKDLEAHNTEFVRLVNSGAVLSNMRSELQGEFESFIFKSVEYANTLSSKGG